jgi:hypothetical protein
MGKKCPPQAFVGIPVGKFFRREDGDVEPKPDGEFPVAIPSPSGDLWMWKAGGFHGRLYWVQLGICHSLAVLLTGQSTMRSQT